MNKIKYLIILLTFTLSAESVKLGPKLQTTISAQAAHPHQGDSHRIQPGTLMKLTAHVHNVGTSPSAPGKIHLRYVFPKPLHKQKTSHIFETEVLDLPSIPSDHELPITFEKTHQWPSLFDFIRHDWAMRNYEAVVNIAGNESITGNTCCCLFSLLLPGSCETPTMPCSGNAGNSLTSSVSLKKLIIYSIKSKF